MKRKRKGQNMDHVIADVVKTAVRTNTRRSMPARLVVIEVVPLPTPVVTGSLQVG